MEKHGTGTFQFVVREEFDVADEAIRTEREKFWNKHLQRALYVAPVAGSLLGFKRPDERKQRISAMKTGKPMPQAPRLALTGKKRSPATIEKLRKARAGRILFRQHRALIARATKGKVRSAEHQAKLTRARTGITKSLESLAKL